MDYTRNTEEQSEASKLMTTSCTVCVVLYVAGQKIAI